MGDEHETLVGSTNKLSLTGSSPDAIRPTTKTGNDPLPAEDLEKTIRRLIVLEGEIESLLARLRHGLSPNDPTQLPFNQLRLRTRKLSSLSHKYDGVVGDLERTTENRVRKLLGCGHGQFNELLSYFDTDIKDIALNALRTSTEDTQSINNRIAAEWYEEVTKSSGMLNINGYFDHQDDSALGGPYDSDYESEPYYEHEDRLDIDEGYAKSYYLKRERINENTERSRWRQRLDWIGFWEGILRNCPIPTLFNPPTCSPSRQNHHPLYLFRVFDSQSRGRNDDDVVASQASQRQDHTSEGDIFSMEPTNARSMLHAHLTNEESCGEEDNLVSWTTSLLFALQYAVYRQYKYKSDQNDIRICVVDTRMFPPGQFIQDRTLIQAFRIDTTDPYDFFNFRLRDKAYFNGEYLSQGSVRHKGKSCTCSLKTMLDAGLNKLYPEFDDSSGKSKWTNRVKELRKSWSELGIPNDEELRRSLELATNCFQDFDNLEMAALLLCFKNRTLERTHFEVPPSWEHQPPEVRRGWGAIRCIREMMKHTMGEEDEGDDSRGERRNNEEILCKILVG